MPPVLREKAVSKVFISTGVEPACVCVCVYGDGHGYVCMCACVLLFSAFSTDRKGRKPQLCTRNLRKASHLVIEIFVSQGQFREREGVSKSRG